MEAEQLRIDAETPAPKSPFASHKQAVINMRKAWEAVDKVTYGEWPDYALNPDGWNSRVKSIAHGYLQDQKIFLRASRNRLIDEAFALAEQRGTIGDKDKFRRCVRFVYRQYRRGQKLKANEKHVVTHGPVKSAYADGFEPDIIAATATSKAYEEAKKEREAKPLTEWDTFDQPKDDNMPKTIEKQLAETAYEQAKQEATPSANNWITDESKRKLFFQSWNNIADSYDLSSEGKDDTLREVAGGKLHDYAGTANDLIKKLKQYCGENYSVETAVKKADISNETHTNSNDDVSPHQSPKKPVIVENSTPDKKTIRKENTIKISGQNYLKAQGRVTMWKNDHPDWTLETDAVSISPEFAVFKASIKNAEGRVVSTGHGMCTPQLATKVSGRFVEKAETAAIARALALAGYGTDDTLDDSDYLSDSPRAA